MSIATRLDNMVPDLNARQRALLVMQAAAAGEEPDPKLRRSPNEQERQIFNRYMGLFYVANSELDRILRAISFHLDRIAEQTTFELLREAAAIAEQQAGEQADLRDVKKWRKKRTVTLPAFLLGVAEEERKLLLGDLLARGKELRALENAWDELSAEFGESILIDAEVREVADEAWAKLRNQLQRLGGPRKVPEPDAPFTAVMREGVRRGFQQLGMVEV